MVRWEVRKLGILTRHAWLGSGGGVCAGRRCLGGLCRGLGAGAAAGAGGGGSGGLGVMSRTCGLGWFGGGGCVMLLGLVGMGWKVGCRSGMAEKNAVRTALELQILVLVLRRRLGRM